MSMQCSLGRCRRRSPGPLQRLAACLALGLSALWSSAPAAQAQVPGLPRYLAYREPWQPHAGYLSELGALAVGPSGEAYVLDTNLNRISKFNPEGRVLQVWGGGGSTESRLATYASQGIDVAPDGSVVVADRLNHRIQRFDSEGGFIEAWPTAGPGQRWPDGPSNLAALSDGSLWVQDDGHRRLTHFSAEGQPILSIGWAGLCADPAAVPRSIAAVSEDRLALALAGYRVQIVESDGSLGPCWEAEVDIPVGARAPRWSLAGVADGSLVIALVWERSYRLLRFSVEGSRLAAGGVGSVPASRDAEGALFGAGSQVVLAFPATGELLRHDLGLVEIGRGPAYATMAIGQLREPAGLEMAPNGTLLVADAGNGRLQRYSTDGRFLQQIGAGLGLAAPFEDLVDVAADGAGHIYALERGPGRVRVFDPVGQQIRSWSRLGGADVETDSALGIAASEDGRVYIADAGRHRVQVFDRGGRHLGGWGRRGSAPGAFERPSGISVNAQGAVLVADAGNHRIQAFAPDGRFLRSIGRDGRGDGQLREPVDVASLPGSLGLGDSSALLAVADAGNRRLHRWDACWRALASLGQATLLDDAFSDPGWEALGQPRGVAVGADAHYVADALWNRVTRFGPSGDVEAAWGAVPTDGGPLARLGYFRAEADLSWLEVGDFGVTPDGLMVAVEAHPTYRIQHFDPNGIFAGAWHIRDANVPGGSSAVRAMAVLGDGSVGVVHVDPDRQAGGWRLLRFTPDGRRQTDSALPISGTFPNVAAMDASPEGRAYLVITDSSGNFAPLIQAFDRWGTKIGTARLPEPDDPEAGELEIALSPSGDVYVAQGVELYRYGPGLDWRGRIGGRGSAPGELGGACQGYECRLDLRIGPSNILYVFDSSDPPRLHRFTADGRLIDHMTLGEDFETGGSGGSTGYVGVTRDGDLLSVDRGSLASISRYDAIPPAGWRVAYRANPWLTERAMATGTGIAAIDFDWSDSAPAPGLPADRFSARFERLVQLSSGPQRWQLEGQGGARLWLGDELLLDAWAGSDLDHQIDFGSPGGWHRIILEFRATSLSPRLRLEGPP